MDKIIEILNAKLSVNGQESNLGMWDVSADLFLEKLAAVYELGMKFPYLMNVIGNQVFLYCELEGESGFIFVIKDSEPEKLKEHIVIKSRDILIKDGLYYAH